MEAGHKEGKQQEIISMFDDIAGTYDLANRVLSMGIDVSWRRKGCELAFTHYGKKDITCIADVACGTGDMILHWRKRAEEMGVTIEKIVGIDPSKGMLKVAEKKVQDAEFVVAEAKSIPLEDQSVDCISIAYGIRNVVDRMDALREFNRILKSGGMLMILEFTRNEKGSLLERLNDVYIKHILPVVGGLVSKNYAAYKYLPDSIEEFLTQKMMCDELEATGFENLVTKGYSGNISTLFIARKTGEA